MWHNSRLFVDRARSLKQKNPGFDKNSSKRHMTSKEKVDRADN